MWEDFMRGNWPAAASAAPTPAPVESYPQTRFRAETAAMVRAEAAPRPVAGKFAVKAALAAGAGLVIAVLAPGAAVAGSAHVTGAHAHIATHAATSP
jgi:hypothetical protein